MPILSADGFDTELIVTVPVKGVSIISVKNGDYKVEEVWFPQVK